MQALKLEATWGLRWILRGWNMFRKQPFGFMATLFMFWLMLLTASALIGMLSSAVNGAAADLVATAGSLLFAALTPALTVGFLQACRVAELDLPVHPFLLFAPLRAGRDTRRRLFALGIIQVAAFALIVLVTSGPAALLSSGATDAPPSASAQGPTPPAGQPQPKQDAQAPDDAQTRARLGELVAEGLAYLPIALVMWYAPMLVAWHGLGVGKSIFFSVVGVWRNLGAFVVYGVTWIVIWTGVSVVLTIVGLLTGGGNATIVVIAPVAMLVLTCMYCSMYQSYSSVYVDSPKPEAPPPATT